jgi:hypothetical protein
MKDISIDFLNFVQENNLEFIYIQELEMTFLVSSITFPYNDAPYIEFKGMEMSKYVTMNLPEQTQKRILKIFGEKQSLSTYKFSNTIKWFYVKG